MKLTKAERDYALYMFDAIRMQPACAKVIIAAVDRDENSSRDFKYIIERLESSIDAAATAQFLRTELI